MISIPITTNAEAALAQMQNLAPQLLAAVARTMDDENLLTIGHINAQRMTGKGPFPVSEHKLGVRTGNLRRSLRASKTRLVGDSLVSTIGSNIVYAGIHEFGGVIKHPPRAGSVRLRTNQQGALLRQKNNPSLAVFAGRRHKSAKEVAFTAGAHEVTMPARAPIATGIEDRRAAYGEAVSKTIEETWKS